MQNQQTGKKGEQIAVDYLIKKGFTILHQNWRFKHWEVDIIASKGNRLHFVEVKTRTTTKFGMPEESINREKMNCLMNASEEFQYQHPEWKYLQFDVLAIMLHKDAPMEVYLIEDVYF